MDADAVSMHITLGNSDELERLAEVGVVSTECSKWGMPLLVMVYLAVGKNNSLTLAHACRLAAELGADIVKCPMPRTPDECRNIIEGCFAPVVFAGGEFNENASILLEQISVAMHAGAAGIAVGRSVFQSDDPLSAVDSMYRIVHDSLDNAEKE